MTTSPLREAIELMRQAQHLIEAEHPLIAAHLETVVGLAAERRAGQSAHPRAGSPSR